MLPPWFSAGLDDWSRVARLDAVDEIASDPYWERGASEDCVREKYRETANKLVEVANRYGKSVQMWVKAYQIEAGRENDLAIAIDESRAAGIKNIFAWSYRGTETLSWLKSDNPDKVAEVFRTKLKNC
jgi:hypothetical protein